MCWYMTEQDKVGRPILAAAAFPAALFSLTATLCAQQPVLHLTLAQAEQLAVQNNPALSAAKFTAAAAAQVPTQYHAAYAPSFSGSITGVGADNGSRLAAGGLN